MVLSIILNKENKKEADSYLIIKVINEATSKICDLTLYREWFFPLMTLIEIIALRRTVLRNILKYFKGRKKIIFSVSKICSRLDLGKIKKYTKTKNKLFS